MSEVPPENPDTDVVAKEEEIVTLPELHLKVTGTEEDYSGDAAAAATVAEAAAGEDGQPLAPNSPFLAHQTVPAAKARPVHLFTDMHGNHKRFGSALGLLTARFVQMILVSTSTSRI